MSPSLLRQWNPSRRLISRAAARTAMRGLSLMELMLAMGLGLLIAGVAMSTFGKVSQLSRTQRGMAVISGSNSALSNYLFSQIRLAGYVDLMGSYDQWWLIKQQDQITSAVPGDGSLLSMGYASTYPGLYALHGCDGSYGVPGTLLNYTCASGSNPLSSSLTVAYQVVSSPNGWNAPSLSSTVNTRVGFMTDCGGRSSRKADNAAASPDGDVVINRYYLDTTNRRLLCIGNGNPTQVAQIASDVDQFQVLYGMAQTGDAEVVGQFVPASTVNATANGWGNVIAVQVCLLISGEAGSASRTSTSNQNVYVLDCAGNPVSTQDGRVRRAVRATLSLRNNQHSATAL